MAPSVDGPNVELNELSRNNEAQMLQQIKALIYGMKEACKQE
jgi:hypothetical protein